MISSATTSWGGTTEGQFTATYTDARGWRDGQNIATASYTTALGIGSALNTSYGFDGYGQLLSSTGSFGSRTFSWTYDLAGNRASDTANGSGTTYTPDTLNRYSSITGNLAEPGIAYDADGNLTQDGTWTYGYDGENRLKSMTKSGQTLTFMYDYAGRRIAKTVNGTTTTFLWAGWKLAAQLANDGYTPQKVFVWGSDFSDAHGGAGGAGALLAQIDSGGVSYAMPDAFGNIVGYVNGSGTLVAATEFSVYGRLLATAGSVANYPIGYAGQYTDAETGLVYYGLRYYSPKHGRFVNRDPIEEAGGNNLYGFTGNSPTNGWDTLGMYPDVYYFHGVAHPEWTYDQWRKNMEYDDKYSNSHDGGSLSDLLGISSAGMGDPGIMAGNGGALPPGYYAAHNSNQPPDRSDVLNGVYGDPSQHYNAANDTNKNRAAPNSTAGGGDWEAQNAAKYAAAGMPMAYGHAVGDPSFLGYVDAPNNGNDWNINDPTQAWRFNPSNISREYAGPSAGLAAFGNMGTTGQVPRTSGNGTISNLGTSAGLLGTSIDIARAGGYVGRALSDALEIASRRLGYLNLGVSAYQVYSNPRDWRPYVDFGVGVAALTIEGAAAPYVVAGAAGYTIWEFGVDFSKMNDESNAPKNPGFP